MSAPRRSSRSWSTRARSGASKANPLVDDLVDRSRANVEQLLDTVRKEARDQVALLEVVSKDAFSRLEEQVTQLRGQIEDLLPDNWAVVPAAPPVVRRPPPSGPPRRPPRRGKAAAKKATRRAGRRQEGDDEAQGRRQEGDTPRKAAARKATATRKAAARKATTTRKTAAKRATGVRKSVAKKATTARQGDRQEGDGRPQGHGQEGLTSARRRLDVEAVAAAPDHRRDPGAAIMKAMVPGS